MHALENERAEMGGKHTLGVVTLFLGQAPLKRFDSSKPFLHG